MVEDEEREADEKLRNCIRAYRVKCGRDPSRMTLHPMFYRNCKACEIASYRYPETIDIDNATAYGIKVQVHPRVGEEQIIFHDSPCGLNTTQIYRPEGEIVKH